MKEPKEFRAKQDELNKLAKIVSLHGGQPLTTEQKAEIQTLQDKLEFRLNALIAESKLREVDIKLEVYKEVIEVINKYRK